LALTRLADHPIPAGIEPARLEANRGVTAIGKSHCDARKNTGRR